MITKYNIFKMIDEYGMGKYTFSTKTVQTRLNDVDSIQYFIENFTDIKSSDIDTYDGNIVTLKNNGYDFLVQISSDGNTDLYNHIIKFVKINIE